MANEWDDVTNPYTGARANAPVPAAPAAPNPEYTGMTNPYTGARAGYAPAPWGETPNPYRQMPAATPWADAPRNPYDDSLTVARDAGRLEALGRVDADKAARDRAAIERLVGAKKPGKTSEATESDADKRLRLLRELHSIDSGTAKMAKSFGADEKEGAKGLREIDRGTERLGRDLGMRPAATERDLATVDAGTARLAEALRRAAAAQRMAPPPPPPPVEADPRLRALDAGNARFGASMDALPTYRLAPTVRGYR